MTSLFIHSVDSEYIPDNDSDVLHPLQALEFLGTSWPVTDGAGYLLGERFFQYVSFAGCAPGLKLEPAGAGDEQFCHIRLSAHPQPRFLFLRPDRPARCPACRKPGVSAAEFAREYSTTREWQCPSCHESIPVDTLDWRKEAGLARFFIEVRDVYPHEGVPTDHLLKKLADISGEQWSWFYA